MFTVTHPDDIRENKMNCGGRSASVPVVFFLLLLLLYIDENKLFSWKPLSADETKLYS